ncbi:MAG: hypothetical protein M1817_000302 [Caeruleum heppii]|nr:MAG: hypothetical protein M1817_000302 [Caeruleum heppii]
MPEPLPGHGPIGGNDDPDLDVDDEGEDDWEVEEGVPKLEDQFIQKYLQGREALKAQEHKHRSDHAFRQTLSPTALEACAIVSRLRDEERQQIWTDEFEDSPELRERGPVFPGMMFTLAKERMETTALWRIVSRMPKGALLHAHFDAMVDIDFLLDQALERPGMHLYAQGPLDTPSARQSTSFFFRYRSSLTADADSIWTAQYQASTFVPVSAAADSFPEGGRQGFRAWVKDRCTITASESVKHHTGLHAIWKKFASTFVILGSLIYYEPIYRASIHHVCRRLRADGVRWVDFRAAFHFSFYREHCNEPDDGYEEVLRIFGEEIERFKEGEEGKDFWGARMIWTSLRIVGKRQVIDNMKHCIAVKKAFPHLIAGYDLVGQEDLGRPLKDLTPELFWFRKRCAEEGLEIPFFFHAGECLGDGDETDGNLFDVLLLGTRRIGHGFSLFKHPLLIDMVKEKRILIESCPISNEVLRLTSSILSHPLPALLARGVHCALANDDPAILGHDAAGLSHDFWQALQGWENLGLAGLGALAENSVRWAAFEDQNPKDWLRDVKDATFGRGTRAERMKAWAVEWERFCQWVVDEYGEDGMPEEDNSETA